MIRGLLIIIFVFLFCFSIGQVTTYEKPSHFITKFPFKQLTGGVILVQARFNNIAQPFNFILDTGSGGISLDSSTTAEFNIPHVPSGKTINGIAGTTEVDYSQNNKLVLPGLTVDSLDFYINNYDILSSVYGEKIDGIIGYSFFSRYIVKINYDSLKVEVYSQGKIEYPRSGYLLHPLFTALPIQPLTIKDARTINANFYIDTGAGLCFLMSKQFEEDSQVLKKNRKPVFIQVQGLGGKKQMSLTIIKGVQIGPYRFRKVPTNILDDEFNATSYPFLGGVIGNDILRRFNVVFNYPKREIHLLPNSHFNDDFDYSYTGLNLYYVDGKIVLDEVITKSPAYKAGLKKDDVIVAVNTNFSNDINVYKNLMQVVGQKITLLVYRNNVPMLFSFHVGRIY
ncbi:MAG TPA: aspartyl protease family protein [Ginsengibacter sp.]|nr:aspartyl protease family protein [Ginsengibacter sp.]